MDTDPESNRAKKDDLAIPSAARYPGFTVDVANRESELLYNFIVTVPIPVFGKWEIWAPKSEPETGAVNLIP
jgi:hypothetical protein